VLGEVVDDCRWPPLSSARLTGGPQRGGLSICLIKVADIGFLLCKDGDLFEVDLS
jgi:hypothetical protein